MNDYTGLAGCADDTPIFDLTGKPSLSELDLCDIHDLNQDLEPAWAMQRLSRYVHDNSLPVYYSPLTSSGCLLVISGLGLGGQLKTLIEWLEPSAIIIAEPDLGVLSHSLNTVDYQWLVSNFTSPGKSLDFVVSKNPDAAVAEIRSLITTKNLFYLDGLFTYVTYDGPYYQLIKQGLHTSTTLNTVNYLGYFVDELHMTLNAYLNYKCHKPKVFNTARISSNDQHAVIVASGPSLASNIELLKEERDRFSLFCCYSTIGALVDKGLTPDYHCDLERHNDHVPLLERGIKDVLKSIDLCCSSTCDPRLLALYKDVYSINRGALTPSVIFSEANDIITNEGPDVATFAILSAIYFGFRTIHLFGVDLGTATRTVNRLPNALDIDRRVYDIPDRGNFGKTVFTSQHLLDNKVAIESNIGLYARVFPGLRFYNYSDGLLINGAEPSQPLTFKNNLPEISEVNTPPKPEFISYSKDHIQQAWQLADMRKRCFAYLNAVRQLVDNPFELQTLAAVSDMCNAYSKQKIDQIPIRFYRGSLFRSWAILNGVYQRVGFESEEKRKDFILEAKSILNDIIDSFESLTFKMLDYAEGLKDLSGFTLTSKLYTTSEK